MFIVQISSVAGGQIFRISVVLFVISSMIMMLIKKIRALFKHNKKAALIYALFILVTFGLVGFLSSEVVLNITPFYTFMGFQFFFLLLGVLHLYILNRYFTAITEEETIWPELLFTLAYLCLGLIAFIQVVDRFSASMNTVFMSASLFFLLPLLVQFLFNYATAIPLPIYRSWEYPLGKKIKDPTKSELSDPYVITLKFKKSKGLGQVTKFRIKAPRDMEFGRLFYFFLEDYNERHPESKIELLDKQSQLPFQWVFHVKPKWWSGIKHINFERSVHSNNIQEDTVVICRRV